MAKQKRPRRGPGPKNKPTTMETASRAIEILAARDGTTPDNVRKHIQLAMMNSLISDDPSLKAALAQIPHAGEIPTPEEVIAYYVDQIIADREQK